MRRARVVAGRRRRCGATGTGMILLALLVAGLPACTKAAAMRTGSIVWHDCGSIECATLSVPLDWSHPSGRHIDLALARHPAGGHRDGVLLTNPGGPGASGVELVQQAGAAFDSDVLDRFDVVSWDPRGAGASAPADCGDRLDDFYEVDRTRTDAATARANERVSKDLVAACEHDSGPLLPFLSTASTVRDMEAIRAALGVPTINYLGFSYGTYIGALYADRYPTRVRSMVLDGAVDPALSYDAATIRQAVGFQHSLDAFLDWCAGGNGCGFAGGPQTHADYEDVMHTLADEPVRADVHGEVRSLDVGEANIGVANALYGGRSEWGPLGAALNHAAQGDGSALLELADQYTGRHPGGTYDDETAAFYAIGCLDAPAPPTLAAATHLAVAAARVSPDFGAATAWLGLPCTYWPAPPASRPAPIHAVHAPPIVVVGNTDDPATPYAQAEGLARELKSGHLLTFVGEGHTAYGRGDDCIDDAVDKYLISLTVPADGLRCT